MEYKKYEYPSFNIYTIKTNRFKSCQMEIVFKDIVNKDDLLSKTFLVDLMTDCSEKYKSRREVVKKLEEYYQASFYGVTNKVGNLMLSSFILNFLNPIYVDDNNYLKNVLNFPFDMIMNPFITAQEFDIKNFNIVKNRLHDEILEINEDISRVAIKKALEKLDNNSPTSMSVLGSLEELEDITPKSLFQTYNDLIEHNSCDIYIVGNLDMDIVANIIYKSFKNSVIKSKDYSLYVSNNTKKLKKYKSNSNFIQTDLVAIYSLDNLTDQEKITTMHFYNYLLGGGGLNTKLYQYLREKNSLCYGIKSVYLKYDNLLLIETSIEKKDYKLACKLINKAFQDMSSGNITEKELNAAKENFIFSLNLALDNPSGILNNYLFHVLDNLPLIEERIKMINNITKEEIVALSNKIHANIVYCLEGDK